MQILRTLQKCGKLKMMAVVRTSLQKVVVLLHRLQRMAVSSPRYQKLCKVTGNREWVSKESTVAWLGDTHLSCSCEGKEKNSLSRQPIAKAVKRNCSIKIYLSL